MFKVSSAGENQTKVGLKSVPPLCSPTPPPEKIRPRWDWNPSYLPQPLVCKTRENQTKVGLKLLRRTCIVFIRGEKIRPRWDWNIRVGFKLGGLSIERKSDQGGIEIRSNLNKLFIVSWGENQTKVGLKLREVLRIKEPKAHRENQTKVGLKSLFSTHKTCSSWEKIRPRWDWNLFSPHIRRVRHERKSDQGGIEIRSSYLLLSAVVAEKIRPRWDWNKKLHENANLLPYRRKSDQGGIEIDLRRNRLWAGAKRKSDQGGIEMNDSLGAWTLGTGENQTKVGLK